MNAHSQLQGTVMTTYQKILAQGEAKGKAEGRAEGEVKGRALGKIQLLEKLLALPKSADELLFSRDMQALKERFEELESLHRARFNCPQAYF